MNRFGTFFIPLLVVMSLTTGHAEAAEYTLTAGHDQPTDASYHALLTKFAELVGERTDGRIEVRVFPGAQLGSELEMAEGLRLGTLDFTAVSVGNVTPLLPKVGLLGAPYLIESNEHRERLIDSDGLFFAALAEAVDDSDAGVELLGITTAGVRSLYNRVRPVATPEDLKGLKIRVMTSDIQMKGWEALGAVPTPMAFSEVYSALASGVIDGAENSPMFLYTMRHHEVADFYSLTQHMVAMGVFLASKRTLDGLPDDLRQIIVEAAAEATAYEHAFDEEMNKEYLDKLVKAGVEINEVDLAPFVEVARPLHDELAATVDATELLAIVREEAAAVQEEASK
jgi:TRAP-type transport system periplasmic protein